MPYSKELYMRQNTSAQNASTYRYLQVVAWALYTQYQRDNSGGKLWQDPMEGLSQVLGFKNNYELKNQIHLLNNFYVDRYSCYSFIDYKDHTLSIFEPYYKKLLDFYSLNIRPINRPIGVLSSLCKEDCDKSQYFALIKALAKDAISYTGRPYELADFINPDRMAPLSLKAAESVNYLIDEGYDEEVIGDLGFGTDYIPIYAGITLFVEDWVLAGCDNDPRDPDADFLWAGMDKTPISPELKTWKDVDFYLKVHKDSILKLLDIPKPPWEKCHNWRELSSCKDKLSIPTKQWMDQNKDAITERYFAEEKW